MPKPTERPEIDPQTLKFIIGSIAVLLPFVLSALNGGQLRSLSDSFYFVGSPDIIYGPWSRTIFVGCLYAIGAFLITYNGQIALEMGLSKVAAIAAILVAMFPCNCSGHDEIIEHVHYVAAAILYLILGMFCLIFYFRARDKRRRTQHVEPKYRQWIYATCLVALWGAMAFLVFNAVVRDTRVTNPVFWGESIGLVAFGVAWLTASHVVPVINHPSERHHLIDGKRSRSEGH
ncbi:hypothetical protein C5614_20195 [Massilia phosphatilytica]|jgi:hypothetical protein|nr:hypothetical protein C5614_20195 [Massilia phosphatilytica]